MVHVENLTKVFRHSVRALDHISFDAKAGEIFGLIGPNGAGKTTALRILSTVLRPTSGIAQIAGFDVARQPMEVRRRVGFQSASTGIYDRMTAWEIVAFFGALNGLEPAALERRMEEVFTQLQMQDFRDVPGSRMS